ncbi:MAG: hypothetical protein JNL80_04255 [Phycisphaerae bacterium]|jgi:hypothetical protein|nr:hypothetical protein [Phycisphaerae bacterium]
MTQDAHDAPEIPAVEAERLAKGPSVGAPPLRTGWWLPVAFLVLAASLATRERTEAPPFAASDAIDHRDSRLTPGPRRLALTDPPMTSVPGPVPDLQENCRACHRIFPSRAPAPDSGAFHRIELRHGMNDRCVNCHDTVDRERLTLRDGSTVPFVDSPNLCAQCHGTLFRDWQAGVHGKTLGSWRTGSAEQRRLQCVECHDPHSPKYPPFEPLPPPNTLRMGEQRGHEGSRAPEESPLRRARDRHAAPKEQENGHG